MQAVRASRNVLQFVTQRPSFTAPARGAKKLSVVDVLFSRGQGKLGAERGPEAIHSTGVFDHMKSLGHTVDHSTLSQNDSNHANSLPEAMNSECRAKNIDSVRKINQLLASHIEREVSTHDQTIVLGGDHSIAIGSITGHQRALKDICVIWIDAHADINTIASSASGNMHGMPVSFLVEELENERSSSRASGTFSKACISSKVFSYIGLRDVDAKESEMLVALRPPIMQFTAVLMKQLGAKEVINRILSHVNPHLDRNIHVSFDIDALDPSIAPSTGTPVPNGLTLEEAMTIGEIVKETNKLSVLDVVEVNPLIGSNQDVQLTVESARQVIHSFISL